MSTQNILLPYKIRDLEISQGYLNRVSKKQKKQKKKKWAFFENAISPSFMKETFPNFLRL